MNFIHLFFGIDPLIYSSISTNEKFKFKMTYFSLISLFALNVIFTTFILNVYLNSLLLSSLTSFLFFIIIFNLLKICIYNIPDLKGKSFFKKFINLETLIRIIIYFLFSFISSFIVFVFLNNKEILELNKSTDIAIYNAISFDQAKNIEISGNERIILDASFFNNDSTHFHLITVSDFCFCSSFFKTLFFLLFLFLVYIQWNMYELKNNERYSCYKIEKEINQDIIDRDKIKTQEYVNQILHKKFKRKDLVMNLFQSTETVTKNKISFEELI
jgi:hypothetical protein